MFTKKRSTAYNKRLAPFFLPQAQHKKNGAKRQNVMHNRKMKQLFRNKTLTWLLVAYGVLQLSSMFLQTPLILLVYELCYLTAIIVGTKWTIKKIKEDRELKSLGQTILL